MYFSKITFLEIIVYFVENCTYDLLSVSHAAIVTSGTATLETALFKVPEIVCYKTSWISYEIGKRLVNLKYISLVNLILDKKVVAGEVVVIRYEGPKGGPGMQEMLYPTSYLKSKGLAEKCALITDGRFSGGTSGLSIGHVSPEAASGGAIAYVENGDKIIIDIATREITLALSEEELEARKQKQLARGKQAYKPLDRERYVSSALKAYALLATSADKGAVRDLEKLEELS